MQDSSYSQQNTIRWLMLGVFPQKIRLLFGRKKCNIIISITWYKIKRELTFKCSYFAFFVSLSSVSWKQLPPKNNSNGNSYPWSVPICMCACFLRATFHLLVLSISVLLTLWKSNIGCPSHPHSLCCLSSHHLLAFLCLSLNVSLSL